MNNRRKEWTPAEVEETGLEQVWRWGRYGIPVSMAEHGIPIRCPRGDVKLSWIYSAKLLFKANMCLRFPLLS